jgi:hypothetical protein
MRKELSKQEYRWLAALVRREKLEAEAANKETPHPLFVLRRDNMESLESRINALIKKDLTKEFRR